jgi:hypothetical protein
MKIKLRQESEGFCLEGCIPSIMRYANIEKGSVKIWHENRDTGEITGFIEGRDYRVDYERGLLARSRDGAVPDYRKSVFYGVTPFNHEKYAEGEWGNSAFTVYASYDYLGIEEDRPENLAKANYRLQGFVPLDVSQFRGNSIRYLVLGDSISTGCEAWPADKGYFFLFAGELERRTGKKSSGRKHCHRRGRYPGRPCPF